MLKFKVSRRLYPLMMVWAVLQSFWPASRSARCRQWRSFFSTPSSLLELLCTVRDCIRKDMSTKKWIQVSLLDLWKESQWAVCNVQCNRALILVSICIFKNVVWNCSCHRICICCKYLQVVMITGASSGLGESLAHSFYKCGCHVILAARRRSELERVSKDLLAMHVVRAGCTCICKMYCKEIDRLRGLVVRVLGYRSGGPGSIPCTTTKKK
jgi:hypothetical protein